MVLTRTSWIERTSAESWQTTLSQTN